MIMDEDKILERWQEYLTELYDDPDRETLKPFDFSEPLSGPEILKSGIEKAMKQMKLNKAPGPDDICNEMMQTLDDMGLNTMPKLFNKI